MPESLLQEGLTILQNNPVKFIEDVYDEDLWPYQQDIANSVRDNKNTSIASCHAIGKSYIAARIAMWFLHVYPQSVVLTTAPTWRQVTDVLWKEIESSYNRAKIKLPGKMLQTRYEITADWFALGLSTDDPDKFQGYHAPNILIVVDESSGVDARIFQAIEGIGSTGFVRILELGNPTDPTGHFANTFKFGLYNTFTITCFDTPNFARFRAVINGKTDIEESISLLLGSTEQQRNDAIVFPKLIVPQWVWERAQEWSINTPMFQSRCLGQFPTEGEDTLIALRHVVAAQDRVLEAKGEEVISVDVARFGGDATVIMHRIGGVVDMIKRFHKMDTVFTTGEVIAMAKTYPYSQIKVDDGGVGGGVVDQLRALGREVVPVNSSSSPANGNLYVNLRAELYFNLSQIFQRGELQVPKDDMLAAELTSLKYRYQNGKMLIESKDDMKKRGLKSPDSADALMISFASPPKQGWLDYIKQLDERQYA